MSGHLNICVLSKGGSFHEIKIIIIQTHNQMLCVNI